MKETWRWFGPTDEISINEIRQTGSAGVVSALHHIPNGAVWPVSAIELRKRDIEGTRENPTGLTWDVVESLPVSEAIKTKGADRATHIEAYKESLRNLAACGIQVICYNFMPVIDWTRTNLASALPHGGTAMQFDLIDFATFDIHLLKRERAQADYSDALQAQALTRFSSMGNTRKKELIHNILAGLPGSEEHWTTSDILDCLKTYDDISRADLQQNLIDFLAEILPTAEEHGLRLCCHPDDPPFPLLGLPRVMSTQEDYAKITSAIDSPANGITFCTGSLGIDPAFDPADFVKTLGPKIHFVHLRNTRSHTPHDGNRTSFFEAAHLGGDTDMPAAVFALMGEEKRRRSAGRTDAEIPMRPDHGQAILADLDRPMMPGYPLIGRMKGLAELRGIIAAYRHING
ncbi:D-mannonate dehydratase [Epibacterium ulvae]|uniref:Mannonate dehydratase n=1 Tax=Epibacterium ulvae TaxID=1156985 RepID=A0A1G5RC85_9RHOB|nr:mannonate dehydratase [Epibacterium ulvae]SCZ71031.1 D-mannonate dehydratase [Epibacterium ulvae]